MKKKYRTKTCHVGDEKHYWYEILWGMDEQAPYRIIEHFNATLHPGEKARKVLKVIPLKDSAGQQHEWEKSNLVTIMKGGAHDTYRCKNCGITSKRYGLASVLIRDTKYLSKRYELCVTKQKKNQ